MAVGSPVFLWRESTADRCADPQRWKIGPRHQLGGYPFGLPVVAKTHPVGKPAEHFREDLVVALEVAIHRKRKCISTPVPSVMETFHAEQHQLLRIFHRQQTQQNLIEQREDRRIRADPQRER